MDPAETAAVACTVSIEGSVHPCTEVIHVPTAVVVTDDGTPVAARGAPIGGMSIDGLLARVGDPVPVRPGPRSWSAEHLVSVVVTDAAAAVAADPGSEVVLAIPDEWHDHRRESLREAVQAMSGRAVTTVGSATGLLEPQTKGVGNVLVVEAGAESIRASVCSRAGEGWQVVRSSDEPWGGYDIDDELLDFVRGRSTTAYDREGHEPRAVRAACTAAREELGRQSATEIRLPSGEHVRLVRADLAALIGSTVGEVMARLVADVAGPEDSDGFSRVLVTGPLAAFPVVVEATTHATGRAVEHVTREQACSTYVAAAAALTVPGVPRSVSPLVPEDALLEDDAPLPMTTVSTPSPPRRLRGRRPALLVVAALALVSSAAAVTVTDVGDSVLSALVDGTVPQESTADVDDLSDPSAPPELSWQGTPAEDSTGTGADTPDHAGEESSHEDTGSEPDSPDDSSSTSSDESSADDETSKDPGQETENEPTSTDDVASDETSSSTDETTTDDDPTGEPEPETTAATTRDSSGEASTPGTTSDPDPTTSTSTPPTAEPTTTTSTTSAPPPTQDPGPSPTSTSTSSAAAPSTTVDEGSRTADDPVGQDPEGTTP